MKGKQPYLSILSFTKEKAKHLTRDTGIQYMKALEIAAKEFGMYSYYELHKRAATEIGGNETSALVNVLECPPLPSIVYRVSIGDSGWSLRMSKYGPKLHLDYRPYTDAFSDPASTSDLGIFPVLQKASKMQDKCDYPQDGWVVARYGQQRCHTIEFMTEAEAKALSEHFGIPFFNDYRRPNQQETSEMYFLKSRAFKHLRHALRNGEVLLPGGGQWNYGLTPIWAHLVAISDEDFKKVDWIVELCFNSLTAEILRPINEDLLDLWETVPNLGSTGAGLNYGFIDVVNSLALGKRR